MSLYFQEITADSAWGIWKMEETVEELLAFLPVSEHWRDAIAPFATDNRKKEWLSVRVLMHKLGGDPCQIEYHRTGYPYLFDQSFHFSCSHTKGFVAVMLHRKRIVGIDIEQRGERILRIYSKFINQKEEVHLDSDHILSSVLLHWSAKESLFKAIRQSAVDFKEHLHIVPFKVLPEGVFVANTTHPKDNNTYIVHYKVEEEFVLTRMVV